MAEQLVCLESLRHKKSCPKDTEKRKNRDERGERQKRRFSQEAKTIQSVSVLLGRRAGLGGEAPPGKLAYATAVAVIIITIIILLLIIAIVSYR